MQQFFWALSIIFLPVALAIFAVAGILYCFIRLRDHDRYKHPEEYGTKGATGERILYLTLEKLGVPDKQILRNVYLPTQSGTTEIDVLVVAKKGLLVFECKNYYGNVYGDGGYDKWIQYIGHEKHYFLSPVVQNHWHVKRLKEYFKDIPELPIIPFVVTTTNANWKLKNIKSEDHVIKMKEFTSIYGNLPESSVMMENIGKILTDLKRYERPDEAIRQAHIKRIKRCSD